MTNAKLGDMADVMWCSNFPFRNKDPISQVTGNVSNGELSALNLLCQRLCPLPERVVSSQWLILLWRRKDYFSSQPGTAQKGHPNFRTLCTVSKFFSLPDPESFFSLLILKHNLSNLLHTNLAQCLHPTKLNPLLVVVRCTVLTKPTGRHLGRNVANERKSQRWFLTRVARRMVTYISLHVPPFSKYSWPLSDLSAFLLNVYSLLCHIYVLKPLIMHRRMSKVRIMPA